MLGASGTGAAARASTKSDPLGRQAFLQLLVTQLRFQDPLNPMDATQFSSQLAEFSSLEQLTELNEGLAEQTQVNIRNTLAINTSLAASLIGKRVLSLGSQVMISDSGALSVAVNVGGMGGAATLRVLDSSGSEIAVSDLGRLAGGRQVIDLNDLNVPSGVYTYEVSVTGPDDVAVEVTHFSGGVVDGVEFGADGPMLRVGGLLIRLSRLLEVEAG